MCLGGGRLFLSLNLYLSLYLSWHLARLYGFTDRTDYTDLHGFFDLFLRSAAKAAGT